MNELYEYLLSELETVNSNVYFERVSSETTFPYITYSFTNSIELGEGDKEDIIIEIDIWNKQLDGNDSISDLEVLTKEVKRLFKKKRVFIGTAFSSFQLIGHLKLEDDDTAIARRQLRFKIRQFA